ncbi:MAG: DUF5694 domain-containing protein [Bacteroidota bacterium]
MKRIIAIWFLSFLFLEVNAQSNHTPEVFLIGVMHQVPKIVKNSYRPLLKEAIKYQPEAIYVERQRPEDTLSLQNYEGHRFLPFSDSIASAFHENKERTKKLLQSKVRELSKDDFAYLSQYFAANRDKANWYYYGLMAHYGGGGSRKPLRNEGSDLSLKLAWEMNINFIHSMDYQHETQEYYEFSQQCYRQSQQDGQINILRKNNKRDYNRAIIPALFGRLGYYTNRLRTLNSYHQTNRFEFRITEEDACKRGAEVWDRRNAGMAYNIGSQILENNHKKSVVVVGAGHIIGLKAALEDQFPGIKIRTIYELDK